VSELYRHCCCDVSHWVLEIQLVVLHCKRPNITKTPIVTAPPAGNVLVAVFKTLRRRRVERKQSAIHAQATTEDEIAAHAEDEKNLSEVKAALRACLVL
jgi:hypothetical protein